MEISKLEQLKVKREEILEKREILKENKWNMNPEQYKFSLYRLRNKLRYIDVEIKKEKELNGWK